MVAGLNESGHFLFTRMTTLQSDDNTLTNDEIDKEDAALERIDSPRPMDRRIVRLRTRPQLRYWRSESC